MICCRCLSNRRSTPIASLAIFIVILAYNVIGGFLFLVTENPMVENPPSILHGNENLSEEIRLKTVERFWEITENILSKENWTKLANQELLNFHKAVIESLKSEIKEPDKQNQHWTYASSFLYASTLITTIGKGNMIPTTFLGKTLAIAYSCIGIPLVMLYLSTVAEVLATKCRRLYSKYCPVPFKIKNFHSTKECSHHRHCNTSIKSKDFIKIEKILQNKDHKQYVSALDCLRSSDEYHWMCPDHTNLPITCSILLIGFYTIVGAFIFQETEGMSFTDAYYFSFSVLTTYGLGSIRPGLYETTHSTHTEGILFAIFCLYILFEIVVVAMCLNLIKDDLGPMLDKLISICMGPPKVRIHYSTTVCEENTSTRSSEMEESLFKRSRNRESHLGSKRDDSNYVRSYSLPDLKHLTQIEDYFQQNSRLQNYAGQRSNSIDYFILHSLSEFNIGNEETSDLETVCTVSDETHSCRVKLVTFEEDPLECTDEANEIFQTTVM